jgi:hypothetical protein
MYNVVQIWSGLFVCKQVALCSGHIWTTLYMAFMDTWKCATTICTATGILKSLSASEKVINLFRDYAKIYL